MLKILSNVEMEGCGCWGNPSSEAEHCGQLVAAASGAAVIEIGLFICE